MAKRYIPWVDGSTPGVNWNLISFKRFYPGTNKLITEGTAGEENNSDLQPFIEGYERPAGSEVITSSEVIGTQDPTIYRKITYGNNQNDTVYSTSPRFSETNSALEAVYKGRLKAEFQRPIKYTPKTKKQLGGTIDYFKFFK